MAQKQRLEVRAYFEQAIINKVIDQWRKRLGAFVKTAGQHFEHSAFMISHIVLSDEIF